MTAARKGRSRAVLVNHAGHAFGAMALEVVAGLFAWVAFLGVARNVPAVAGVFSIAAGLCLCAGCYLWRCRMRTKR